ncbi:replication restart helicase PriA [Clostridium aminobutyricum]|uniref:Replication restart protein PriA n=1 Tax=Clostridium aminobutyricum TaxID=33953 RepID=A0A939IFX0_CLOAM|nr:primosomal protein N' [Clostridium aminobutyricum]MBN7772045.1 primosomal protein N' [Clostridium aminobutyricum]
MKYVNVAIDNNNDNTDLLYTYGSQFDQVKVGQKVLVPFAKGNRLKDAYVFEVRDSLEQEIKGLKYIDRIDSEISLTEEMMETCKWMRTRYLCRYMDGINCFIPSGAVSKRGKKRIPYQDSLGQFEPIDALTEEQIHAIHCVQPSIEKEQHELFLVHGVTGSGKTEVYIQLIKKVLEKGKNAIVLVPEISLTTQVIQRFIGRFGQENIAVLHSKLSLGERYDEWMRIRNGQVRIAIGARSAVFAPFDNIGIIIMDEEHESTYKSDMSPKYDTLEVAIKRVKAFNGVLVSGSATPSVVSNFRVQQGIYKKIELRERYNKLALPKVEIIDMRQELKNGNKSIFSQTLYQRMRECLQSGRQVILFLNRRGYSTFISCRECGYVMKCPECGISLTYHKAQNAAVCHYCGRMMPLPNHCPECNSKYIKHFGTGTEKVEEMTAELFPEYSIERLDLDSIKRKGSLDKILDNFRKEKTKILIGTQLVAKGLDFKNVGLVGIISADVMLNIPDFRAAERTFQLITQAAGRAGRGEEEGNVVIQSYNTEHYSILAASHQDYQMFYDMEILLRKHMCYPPYSDILQVIILAGSEEAAANGSLQAEMMIKKALSEKAAENVFPPQPLMLNKQKETYRYYILIKCPSGKRNEYLTAIHQVKKHVNTGKKTAFSVSVDINPYSIV